MASHAPGPKIDRQPDRQRMNGPDQPAHGDDAFRWCVVAGTLLLGLAVLTLSLNGGSLNITPNVLSLSVNPRR